MLPRINKLQKSIDEIKESKVVCHVSLLCFISLVFISSFLVEETLTKHILNLLAAYLAAGIGLYLYAIIAGIDKDSEVLPEVKEQLTIAAENGFVARSAVVSNAHKLRKTVVKKRNRMRRRN